MLKKLFFTFICLLTFNQAFAAVNCIALTPETSCTLVKPEEGQSDWSADCNGINIKAVSACGHVDKSSFTPESGWITESVRRSGNVEENTDCFCKMVQPAVSRWVYYKTHITAGDCSWWCSNACAGAMAESAEFRASVLGELYD